MNIIVNAALPADFKNMPHVMRKTPGMLVQMHS
jgi:hypothetical protein